MSRPTRADRSRRVGRWLIGSAVGLALALVAARAGLAAWYRHNYKQLADAGRLPSQLFAGATAEAPGGLPFMDGKPLDVVTRQLRLPLPFRPDPSGGTSAGSMVIPPPPYRWLIAGDVDRYGWQFQLGMDAQGRMTSWQSNMSDEVAVGPAEVWSLRWVAAHNAANPVLARGVVLGTLATLIGWPFGWRRTLAVPTLAVAIVFAASVMLTVSRDHIFVRDTPAEPLRWWPAVLLVPAAALAAWPSRRHRFGPGRCDRCGYDLTGNVSGTCPECGSAAGGEGPVRSPVPSADMPGAG